MINKSMKYIIIIFVLLLATFSIIKINYFKCSLCDCDEIIDIVVAFQAKMGSKEQEIVLLTKEIMCLDGKINAKTHSGHTITMLRVILASKYIVYKNDFEKARDVFNEAMEKDQDMCKVLNCSDLISYTKYILENKRVRRVNNEGVYDMKRKVPTIETEYIEGSILEYSKIKY